MNKRRLAKSRSYAAGEVEKGELLSLTKAFKWSKSIFGKNSFRMLKELDIVVIDGDLRVTGDLDLFDEKWMAIVVRGSLHVSRLFRDQPGCGTFVLGAMTARNAVTAGALCVGKSLTVKEALIGRGNDYSAEIHGAVKAAVFAPSVHWFDTPKPVRAATTLDASSGFGSPELAALQQRVEKGLSLRKLLPPRTRAGKQSSREKSSGTLKDVGARFFRPASQRKVMAIWQTGTTVTIWEGKKAGLGTEWGTSVPHKLTSTREAAEFMSKTIASWQKRGLAESA
ncbi:MAG: hypothetical protein K0S65_1751 [Labilithrix sp.]|nr:hypothetical protein [Labilithrix sp.]